MYKLKGIRYFQRMQVCQKMVCLRFETGSTSKGKAHLESLEQLNVKEIKQDTTKDVSFVKEGKIHMSCVPRSLKWLNKKNK